MAVDVYLQWTDHNAPPTPITPLRFRVALICVGWGMGILTEQISVDQGPWHFYAWFAQHPHTQVQDQGLMPLLLNALPPPAVLQALGHVGQPAMGAYIVNGQLLHGWHCPWHHRLRVRNVAHDNFQLHYHEHERRRGHGHHPPLPKDGGKYRVMDVMGLGTQIQNFRDGFLL